MRALLQSLFKVTPPTALIVSDHRMTPGVWAFLMERGLRVPGDVSLMLMEMDDAEAAWIFPSPSRLRFDFDLIGDHVFKWVERTASGNREATTDTLEVGFIPGATIAPPAK